MAVQPPFRSDAYEVENADAPVGPRLIEADTTDGSLRFTDPQIPGGINLWELAGLQQAGNTIVVSPTGTGASKNANGEAITTIQAALDAVPDSADVNDPWTIVLTAGIYIESIRWIKDGVTLRGLGGVTIRETGGTSTIQIVQGPVTLPRRIKLQDLRIENTTVSEACIDISSAQFATGTFTIASVPNVGDTATVDVTVLMAIANGSVPAPGEFELGTDTATTAANLADAINDPVNGLTTLVVATVTGSVVTIRALATGVAGNAIALASSVPLVIVPSGATLTGGAASTPGSAVGDNLIEIIDCDLIPTVATGFQLRAAAVNNIYVRGGNWEESATGTTVSVTDCALFRLLDIPYCNLLALNYDNTNPDLPSIGTSSYELQNVKTIVASTLTCGFVGVGSITLTDTTITAATVYSGDAPAQSFTATRCNFGTITMGGVAPAMVLSNCVRGMLTGGGTGTLAETRFFGSAVFGGVPVVTVPFPEPQPDTAYTVLLEMDGPPAAITDVPAVPVAAKLTTGFDIAFGAPQALTINFVVMRDI